MRNNNKRKKSCTNIRNAVVVLFLVVAFLDAQFADISGRVMRRFRKEQRYTPASAVKAACRASLFREFRPAPVIPTVSRIDEPVECDLKAGLAIGYNCKNWWNPVARNSFYAFFTLDPEVDVYVSREMLQKDGIFDDHVHSALGTAMEESASCDSRNPVLDVGSNLGSLTLAAASNYGCAVHAFELQKDIACRVRMSAAANSLNKLITVHNNAVSSIDGKQVTFHGNEKNPGGTGMKDVVSDTHRVETSNIVTTVTLDNLFLGKVESIPFMKIDTEGHEHEVLKSAKLLLSRDIIKYLVVEIRRHQTQMVNFLYENRFTCRLLDYKKKNFLWNGNPKCKREKLETLQSQVRGIVLFSDLFCCHE